jgi:hypothetical protein
MYRNTVTVKLGCFLDNVVDVALISTMLFHDLTDGAVYHDVVRYLHDIEVVVDVVDVSSTLLLLLF